MSTQKSTSQNPFLNFDPAKLMAQFDPANIAEEFAKFADKYKVPGLDTAAIADAQKRNVEALTAANKAAAEGMQALATRQGEILNQTLETAKKAMDKLGKAATPEDAATKQAEYAKDVFKTALATSQELSEMAVKSNTEALKAITTRIAEGLGEIQTLAEKVK
ncbi:MAG: TIGR01841 family phasin [Rhodospirillales bacterium]|nr:TIGR01841 family phasin [Rhodospirillales bacterium]